MIQSTSQLAIESKEKRRLDDLAIFLTAAVEGRSTNNVVQPGSVHVDAITSVLSRWPLEQRWPLIDLGRLVAGLAPTAFSMTPRGAFVASLARAADWSGPWSGITPQRATNIGLVLRAASNAMIGGSGADATEVLAVLDPVPYINLNKASRLVYATLLFK
jgi:phospholipase A-2-activating protein